MDDTDLLIIGGAGYFGARLASALSTQRAVAVTYRSLSSSRASWLKTADLKEGVVYNSAYDNALPLTGKVGAVINLAMPSAKEAASDPEGANARALKTIDAVLQLLKEGRVEQVLHFSTFHVYGNSNDSEYLEAQTPQPRHPYGVAHALVEERIAAHACADRVTVFRPTNLVGAPAHADLGDQSGLVFLDFCRQALKGRIRMRNDGCSYRDILPFSDAIAAVNLVLSTSDFGGRVVNLAAGETIRLDKLAKMIGAAAQVPVDICFGTDSDVFREPFSVNTDRLRDVGWAPKNDFGLEVKQTMDFFQ